MLKRCSYDGKRGAGGVATSYWRWFVAPSQSVGYRVYTCLDCTTGLLLKMGAAAQPSFSENEDPTCVNCGGAWTDGEPAVWGYMYMPRAERVDYEVPLCGECLDPWVQDFRQRGTVLTERDETARARAQDPWAGLIPARQEG